MFVLPWNVTIDSKLKLRRVSAERPLGPNLCRLVKKNAIHGHLY